MIYQTKIFKKLASILPGYEELQEEEDILDRYNLEEERSNPKIESDLFAYVKSLGITLAKDIINETSFLGQGGFAKVFRCIYKGKHCALKIFSNQQDLDAYKKLISIRNSLGNSKRYFVEIYLLDKFRITTRYKKTYNVNIIVTEFLKPLNPHLKEILFGEKIEKNNSSIKVDLMKEINSFVDANVFDLKQSFNDEFIGDNSDTKVRQFKLMVYEILNNTSKDKAQKAIQSILELTNNINNNNARRFVKELVSSVFSVSFYSKTPSSYVDEYMDPNNFRPAEELKGFYDALHKAAELGFIWSDLNKDNVMERPSTREPVISDVGSFTSKEI